LICF
jgi:WD40 repeat protein